MWAHLGGPPSGVSGPVTGVLGTDLEDGLQLAPFLRPAEQARGKRPGSVLLSHGSSGQTPVPLGFLPPCPLAQNPRRRPLPLLSAAPSCVPLLEYSTQVSGNIYVHATGPRCPRADAVPCPLPITSEGLEPGTSHTSRLRPTTLGWPLLPATDPTGAETPSVISGCIRDVPGRKCPLCVGRGEGGQTMGRGHLSAHSYPADKTI